MIPSRGEAPAGAVARVRLSPSAGVARTADGVILRSDLGAFQIAGPDIGVFLDRMVPLLDGSRDEEAIVRELAEYARPSVATFLGLLRERGLVEAVPDGASRWQGQDAFFRSWGASPSDVMRSLAGARVLIAGLEPWGAAAALELAASGVGMLHVIDDGVIGPEDASLLLGRGGEALAPWRADALAARIGEESPWCRVEVGLPAPLGDDIEAGGPWSLLVAAIPPGDAARIEQTARLAHRAKIPSLWSHLAGTTAVLGPLVTPGQTACRVCAAATGINPPLGGASRPISAPQAAAAAGLLGHLVALEVLRQLSEYTASDVSSRVLIEDAGTGESVVHEIVRLPWCRVCGADG